MLRFTPSCQLESAVKIGGQDRYRYPLPPYMSAKHTDGQPWVGRLLPVAILVILFCLLEGGARVAIWARFGKAQAGAGGGEVLTYAPYLMSLYPKDEWVTQPVAKDPGKFRVVVVGSSTANKLTDEQLIAAFQPYVSKPVEVYNMAQGGYIANQELLMLTLYGLDYRPDLVLSLGGLNDFVAMSKTGEAGIPTDNTLMDKAMKRPIPYALRQAVGGFQLTNAIEKLGERRREVENLRDEAKRQAVIDGVSRTVGKMAAISQGAGFRYIGVLQPFLPLKSTPSPEEERMGRNYLYRRDYMVDGMTRLRQNLAGLSMPKGATFVDAIGVFDGNRETTFLDDAHLNEKGNVILLERTLREAAAKGIFEGL